MLRIEIICVLKSESSLIKKTCTYIGNKRTMLAKTVLLSEEGIRRDLKLNQRVWSRQIPK